MGSGCCGGAWFMFLGSLAALALIVLVVLLVHTFVARSAVDRRESQATSKSAHDLLAERYARGEIDREEFEERRRTLKH